MLLFKRLKSLKSHEVKIDLFYFLNIHIYIYAFGRRFYTKQLTLCSWYTFNQFTGNQTNDLGAIYCLSYGNTVPYLTVNISAHYYKVDTFIKRH